METENPGRTMLAREAKRAALEHMESAARTVEDFNGVIGKWDKLDGNRERRERYHEPLFSAPLVEWGATLGNAVVPQPFGHPFWRQLLSGNFLDVIFDCPHELDEQVSSKGVSQCLRELNDNQKEVLYYWAIRQYSPQWIARFRGQSDRNILKVYDTLIKGIQKKLYERYAPRYFKDRPLTAAQKRFVEDYIAGKFKKKTAVIDSGESG